MTASVETLLERLPPYRDEWVLIHPAQSVKDIIREALEAHKEFAPYYDNIALFFDADTIEEIAENLYNFCKANIRYQEETEDEQTTALPSGILTRRVGDCKHYSGFSAGVLDALTRLTDKKINWCYRFASYDILKQTPHHVFVVVKDGDDEIWIDPTPGADVNIPVWQIDKKIKAKTMALHRNIAGVDFMGIVKGTAGAIGISNLTVTPLVNGTNNDNNINWDGTNKYAGTWTPYLGLSMYRDLGGDRNINEANVAALINDAIAAGPNPGHTVTPEFVKWVYNENLRSWNFYYPGGVQPGFTAAELLPATWPRLVVTDDGRLTFDRDIKIDDYRNAEIHLLTAWAQALINQYDPTPYPVKPLHLKEFSQLLYGNVDTRNLFTERRGAGFFAEVGKALEDAVNFVKDKVLTVVGFIPRNAFLGLVGINAFNFAGNLWDSIQAGHWEQIASTWEKLGGKPEKLRNTIEDGKEKNAILGTVGDYGEVIGVEPVSSSATLLAAAAPIIAALLAFLDKDGKVKEVLSATKTFLQKKYPNIDLTAYGFLDQPGGSQLLWEGDPKYNENLGAYNPGTLPPNGAYSGSDPITWAKNNPLPVSAGAAAITYFLTSKKGKKPDYTTMLLVGGGTYLVLMLLNKKSATQPATTNTAAQLQYINSYIDSTGSNTTTNATYKQLFSTMTASEISSVYYFFKDYVSKNIAVPAGSELYNSIMEISTKYNVFL